MKKNEDKPVVIKLDRKKIKQLAKGRVKRNYIACIAVCFIMVFIAGEYGSTTQNVSSYDNSHVADLKYDAEDKEEIIEDMVKNELTAEQVSDRAPYGKIPLCGRAEPDEKGKAVRGC